MFNFAFIVNTLVKCVWAISGEHKHKMNADYWDVKGILALGPVLNQELIYLQVSKYKSHVR